MPERHTLVFTRCGFNVLTDHDRRTITLQFEDEWPNFGLVPGPDGRVIESRRPRPLGGIAGMLSNHPIDRIFRALRRRFGGGLPGRLIRWASGKAGPLVLPAHTRLHPDNPVVICFEIGVRDGERMDAALAALLTFLRRLPGYQRTYGEPLDRDGIERAPDGGPWMPRGRPKRP